MSDRVREKRVCVVQQVDHAGPGRIAEVFASRGVPWDLCRAGEGESLPPAHSVAGILLLGGPMSANDALPFLAAELRLLEDALRLEVPVLGVCLGAQLLAKALGASVIRGAMPEIGWGTISPTEAADGDPVCGGIRPGDPVPQWHFETFSLPSKAVRLAESRDCENQAFRWGAAAWGVQFHPEVNPEIWRTWLNLDARAGAGAEANRFIDPDAHRGRASTLAGGIFGGWAGVCGWTARSS